MKKRKQWELSFGSFPGLLFGMRTYEAEECTSHVLYIGFFDIVLTTYEQDDEEKYF